MDYARKWEEKKQTQKYESEFWKKTRGGQDIDIAKTELQATIIFLSLLFLIIVL